MSHRITRRTVAKILLGTPAVIAFPTPAEASPESVKKPARPALTAAERRNFEKSVKQIRGLAEKIRATQVPMGAEPAFVFQPLLPRE